VSQFKGLPKDLVATAARFTVVQFEPRLPVVPVVDEDAVFLIEGVRPVRLGESTVENYELRRGVRSAVPKATLIPCSG
jgi:hypothetical protein